MSSPNATEIEFAKQLTLRGIAGDDNASVMTSGTVNGIVANAAASAQPPMTEQQEMQNLKQVITAWRQSNSEVADLNAQIREKRKRMKALEEMILRIMKKNNIGALDLKGSGGRLLYRRKTTKGTLNGKTLNELLTQHLKSETAAGEALKFINENRGSKVHESLLYEKEF
jgi:hypothetical protein